MRDQHEARVTPAGVLCSCGRFFTGDSTSDALDRWSAHRDIVLGSTERKGES